MSCYCPYSWAGPWETAIVQPKDISALGTAQRGTVPTMIVAQGNFDDLSVLMIITLVNLNGVITLIIAAKTFSRDNTCPSIEPVPVRSAKRTRV